MLIPLFLYGLHCTVMMLKEAVDLIRYGLVYEIYLAT